MGVLEDLLARGHLPVQLPPGFSSQTFSSELSKFKAAWHVGKPPATLAEKFSVPRSSFYRRSTAIVNPIGFYFLAREIASHWAEIEKHYGKSALSRSVPTLGQTSLRAIQLRKFSELYDEKITTSAGYRFALVTDISSFFSTIYTHTISWALHGKSVGKESKKKKQAGKSPAYLGDVLDERCMDLQDRQTIGLPIGPDTSHIVAEIITTAIDDRLVGNFGSSPAGFRYVDDFFFFFNRREDAEKALAAVTKAVGHYELQLNPAKTKIMEVRELVEESWKYSLKSLRISPTRKQQRDDLHHYFETLFALEKRYRDESLIKYGLKQLSSKIVKTSNWTLLEAYLLECGYGFPNTIQVIARYLMTYRHHGYVLNMGAITRFCNNLIRIAAGSDHHGEVAWLLWICKELTLPIEDDLPNEIQRMGSSVCTLILLDLRQMGLATGAIDTAGLLLTAVEGALKGPPWLLAYEAGRRQWLGNQDVNFIANHAYFGALLSAGVGFYHESARLTPMFDFRDPASDTPFDFDTDSEITGDFEFDDLDEEYSDSVERDDEDTDETSEGRSGEDADGALTDNSDLI
jgi:hypothetical protein